jgi:uncharacterized membrane protein YgaE (UPF0421/DUF939 family)
MSNLDIRTIGLIISCLTCVLSLCINLFLIPKTKKLDQIEKDINEVKQDLLKEVANITVHNTEFRENIRETYVSKENIHMLIENKANRIVIEHTKNCPNK